MRSVFWGLVLVGLLASTSPSQGQDSRQYGLTLGVNRVTLQSPASDLSSYFAGGGGFVARQRLYGPVSVQAELLLSQNGGRVDSDRGGAIDYEVGYLKLPLLLHLQTPTIQSIALHGEAGGFGAVKVFERQTPGDGDVSASFDTGQSFYRRLDAGGIAGVGATVPIGARRLNLTVRRVWGLRDVAQGGIDQQFSDAPFPEEAETRAWSLVVRLGF
ncbi:porin family protein [Salinibacter altiplanensis]|uniref:porin family protein n=1 Tax=Salinibacter altiplanensis TaxID=1803181 RepID=UPI000C9FB277|nr:porin family protein [Salinibacter altiplanensis]